MERDALRYEISGGNKMSKADVIEVEGTVVEKLPNAMFQVELENGHQILQYLILYPARR